MSKCPRVIHVACSDRAGPNIKSDKSLDHEKSGNSERLHLWCDVHKSHTSQTHQLDLQKPVVSGILNVALSQKPGGTTDKFRQVVKLCMRVSIGMPLLRGLSQSSGSTASCLHSGQGSLRFVGLVGIICICLYAEVAGVGR